MIETQNLIFQYEGGPELTFPNLKVAAGESVLVLGPSGKGKTTFLHLISGLLTPKSGNVLVANQNLFALNGKERDQFRGKNVGIVFQKSHLIKSLSALENVLMAQVATGASPTKDRAEGILRQLGLEKQLHQKSFELSVGEQQRVAIARALINQPKLLIADEPTSALDDAACKEVTQLLDAQARKAGPALIIVTHDERFTTYFTN